VLCGQRQRTRTHPWNPRPDRSRTYDYARFRPRPTEHRVLFLPRRLAIAIQGEGRIFWLHTEGYPQVRQYLDDAQLCKAISRCKMVSRPWLMRCRHIGAGTTRMRPVGTASAEKLKRERTRRLGTRKTQEWSGGAKSKWQSYGKSWYGSVRERDGVISSLL
jgi:hypothetical protein